MPERDVRIRVFLDDSNIKQLSAMTVNLQKAAAAEKALTREALRKNKALKKQKDRARETGKEVKQLSARVRDYTRSIVRNIGKVAEWGIATGLIYGSIRTLRTAIDDIIDVEFAMAGLTKVMQDGGDRAKMLRSELLALGQQYGELGTAVINASTEFARLQITNFEIAQSTEAALLAQAIAEMQVVDASRFLIASMQQFEQTSLSNLRTLDQWNELSNRTASRALDLAQAVGKAGSTMQNAGTSMAFLNGMTAALVEATGRTGSAIGNAERTMGTYMFRLRSVSLLEKTGIKVRNEATGQLKSFEDVISDTAVQWVLFTDVQKRAIAQAIAGTRRQNEFLTLMRVFPEVLKDTEIALNSFGSAEEEAAIILDTAQKKAEQFRAGLQRLAAEYSNTKGLKLLLDGLNNLINALVEAKGFILLLGGSLTLLALRSAVAISVLTRLRMALMSLAAAHPVLLALTAAAAIGIGIYAALNREAEDFLKTMLDMAQAGVGLAQAEEQRAKRLETLIKFYNNAKIALDKATDPTDVKKLTDSMAELAKEIESAAQAGDKAFKFDLADAEASLTKATAIVNKLRQSYEELAASARKQTRESIDSTRRQVSAIEAYAKVLTDGGNKFDAWTAAVAAFGGTASETAKALEDTSLFITNAFVQGKIPGGAKEADTAIKTLNATLAELEDQLAKLDLKKTFHDAVSDAIDLKRLLREINARMLDINEAARHQAALARFGGATQMDTLRTVRGAISTNIALVQKEIGGLIEKNQETEKLDALLVKLNQDLTANANKIEEANQAYRDASLTEYIKRRTDEIKVMTGAAVQRAKDSDNLVLATKLEIQALEQTKDMYQAVIREAGLYGHDTGKLEQVVNRLNQAIAIQSGRLNDVIIPMERAKRLASLRAIAEEAFRKRLEESNVVMERQIRLFQASGATEEATARIRVAGAKRALILLKGRAQSLEQVLELVQQLKDAYVDLDVAVAGRQAADFETRLRRQGDETVRQIELAKAWGATGVQSAQMRIEAVKQEMRAVAQSSLTYNQKFTRLLELSEEMKDSVNDLAIEEIDAARQSAEAWMKAYEKRADAWAKLIGKGLSKKGIFETLERLQREMVDRWVRTAFEPVIERLTKWEFQMLGIDPEQMRKQEENRNKMTQALMAGGVSVQQSIAAGANYHAAAIRSAMTSQAMPSLTTMIPGRNAALPYGAPGGPLGPPSPPGGFSAGQTAFMLSPFVLNNAQDWATGRGGGVRFAGAAIGGAVGGITTGQPAGVAFGAQAGNELVSALQGLKNALFDNTEAQLRPAAETLREQVGSAINRGTFGNAANITYHQEFNITMGFMIPEREGVRKAARILKAELSDINANVTVG